MQLAPSVWGWHIKTKYKYRAVSSTGEHYVSSTLFFYKKKKKNPKPDDSVLCHFHYVTTWILIVRIHPVLLSVWWARSQRGLPLWVSLCTALWWHSKLLRQPELYAASVYRLRHQWWSVPAWRHCLLHWAEFQQGQRALVHSKLHKITLLTLVPAGIY